MKKNCKKSLKRRRNKGVGVKIWRKNYKIWNMIMIRLSKK